MICIKYIVLTIVCTLVFSTITIAHGGNEMESKYIYT
jgi:hypothetical protein